MIAGRSGSAALLNLQLAALQRGPGKAAPSPASSCAVVAADGNIYERASIEQW